MLCAIYEVDSENVIIVTWRLGTQYIWTDPRGVARGKGEGGIVDWVYFLREKLALLGRTACVNTVLSSRCVLWAPGELKFWGWRLEKGGQLLSLRKKVHPRSLLPWPPPQCKILATRLTNPCWQPLHTKIAWLSLANDKITVNRIVQRLCYSRQCKTAEEDGNGRISGRENVDNGSSWS